MAAKKKPSSANRSKERAKAKRANRLAPNAIKRGLSATEVALALDHADIAAVVDLVHKAGGAPLGAYREPLGGRPLLLASLPFSAVQPTPFQRDLSPTHAKRLAGAIEATAAFLDPLIVVRGEDGLFRTTDGAPAPVDANVRVVSGVLENSNVNVADAMVNMIELSRNFDLQVKAMRAAEENGQASAQLLRLG